MKPLIKLLINFDVSLVYVPSHTIRELFSQLKSKPESLNKCNVVYCVHCKTCNYIGQASEYLKTRLYQHTYNLNYNVNHSGLNLHVVDKLHSKD